MTGKAAYPWSAGFRTLDEEHSYRIDEIDGQVPAGLRGTLFRNGSGRNELGGQWFPHWFDGDGMISAIRFDDGGIHYRNRYSRPTTTATRPAPAASSIAASARCGPAAF
jgi:all-trans-8'-apo-beta-carotenal 15,15'-oxygenase